jgi:HNH endonuclease
MSRGRVPAALREAVRSRAGGCCEYCRLPDGGSFFGHEPDHIIATQHGGKTTLDNLALACLQCNRCKGPNLVSVDPETKQTVRLFNPRTDRWSDHFRTEGGRIVPFTPVGRATAALLQFSRVERQQIRQNLWLAGRYPPEG